MPICPATHGLGTLQKNIAFCSQETLRTASTSETGTSNALGDKQLVADVAADRCADGGCFGDEWLHAQASWVDGATRLVRCYCRSLVIVQLGMHRHFCTPSSALPSSCLECCSCVFDALRACGAVELASSEEAPSDHELGGSGCAAQLEHCCACMLLHGGSHGRAEAWLQESAEASLRILYQTAGCTSWDQQVRRHASTA